MAEVDEYRVELRMRPRQLYPFLFADVEVLARWLERHREATGSN